MIIHGDVIAIRWRGRFIFAEGDVRVHWLGDGFGCCDTAGTRLWAGLDGEVWAWRHSETVTDAQVVEAIHGYRPAFTCSDQRLLVVDRV